MRKLYAAGHLEALAFGKKTMRKLIRNKIPSFILGDKKSLVGDGGQGLRKMSQWEYPYALQLKLHEEWSEAWASPSAEELGDCLQVLIDTALHMGIDWDEVVEAQKEKLMRRGGFDERWELLTK